MAAPIALSPSCFADTPARQAAVRPDAVALRFGDRDITYAQLSQDCAQCASLLWHSWGVRPGDRVAWLGLNHPGQLVLLFALARIGAILLPLNTRLACAEWEQQLRDCKPSHLVCDEAFSAQGAQLALHCSVTLHRVIDLQQPAAAPAAPVGRPDAPVLLVYTSGTTGLPRAAVHTQANLLANMRIASQVQEMTREDRVLTVLPLFHVGGLCIQTLPALHAGARVTLHPRFSADAVLGALSREATTLTLQVPATMKALVDHPRWLATDLSSLRAAWAGSSVLPMPLVRAFLDRGVPLCNVYGSTETGPFSIALAPPSASTHAGSCGWPAPGVEAMLADVRDGVGELLVRGPNVVRQYWGDHPACDAQGWFQSGDLAKRADDGSYTVVGRAKDLIISGGENIHPLEIETVAGELDAIAECAAFGLPDARWGEIVALAIVLRAGAQLTEATLREHLAARLARFKQPRRLLFVDALPTTALGKLQRHALAGMVAAEGRDPGSRPG